MGKQSRKRRQKRNKKRRTTLVYTPLKEHVHAGKQLLPPFAKLEREIPIQRTDWAGERLPEMLWAALAIAGLGRDESIERFRRLGSYIAETCHADASRENVLSRVTFSGLAKWNEAEFQIFLDIIVGDDEKVFQSLLRFDSLPGFERWQKSLVETADSFDLLEHALALTLWHQAQEATDCRWMSVLAMLCGQKLHLPSKDLIREILEYPNYGDQQAVRPSIRANEGAVTAMEEKSGWPREFWKSAWEMTKDNHRTIQRRHPPAETAVTRDAVASLREMTLKHYSDTTQGTEVDARHDAAFGFSLYAIDILLDLLAFANASRILARMALRSLAELAITFRALAIRDDQSAWVKFRDYGYGQAKLAYLKLLDTENLPGFVTVETLEQLSNENVWHEFQSISIGNWDDADLRKLSETAKLKADVYDPYYDWTSAFVHANWAAIRDATYELCINPMHRLHRIPASQPLALPDVIHDAAKLVNLTLDTLAQLYPGVDMKLKAD